MARANYKMDKIFVSKKERTFFLLYYTPKIFVTFYHFAEEGKKGISEILDGVF